MAKVRASERLETNQKLTTRQVSQARANIARKAGFLLDRLYKNAMGQLFLVKPDENGEPIAYELSMGQIRSAEVVLRKIVPDLTNMTVKEDKSPDTPASKDELVSRLKALLAANPDLREMIPTLAPYRAEDVLAELDDTTRIIDGEASVGKEHGGRSEINR